MPDDRLIVGLDLPDRRERAGASMVPSLGDAVGFYKLGLGLVAGRRARAGAGR